MRVSHYLCGVKKDGYTKTIHEAGLSGTVATIWVEGWKMKMYVKSRDGTQYGGIQAKYEHTVGLEIYFVGLANDKLYFIGVMIAGSSKGRTFAHFIHSFSTVLFSLCFDKVSNKHMMNMQVCLLERKLFAKISIGNLTYAQHQRYHLTFSGRDLDLQNQTSQAFLPRWGRFVYRELK